MGKYMGRRHNSCDAARITSVFVFECVRACMCVFREGGSREERNFASVRMCFPTPH